MALAVVLSRGLAGLDAPLVTVEVHLAGGLPAFNLVGLPDTEVKESRDRVRAALQNAQFEFPARKITVNLAPADLPKESGRYDLPIAIGILAATGQVPDTALPHTEFAGDWRWAERCGPFAERCRWRCPRCATAGLRPAGRERGGSGARPRCDGLSRDDTPRGLRPSDRPRVARSARCLARGVNHGRGDGSKGTRLFGAVRSNKRLMPGSNPHNWLTRPVICARNATLMWHSRRVMWRLDFTPAPPNSSSWLSPLPSRQAIHPVKRLRSISSDKRI